MQTAELRFILKHCFDYETLQSLLPGSGSGDIYESALQAILMEDEAGFQIVEHLDQLSEKQRAKINAMSPKELRNSLSLGVFEPGRKLGLMVWALMRDNRIGVQSIAGELVEEYDAEESAPPPTNTSQPESFSTEEVEVDELIADLKSDEPSEESIQKPLSESDIEEAPEEEFEDIEIDEIDLEEEKEKPVEDSPQGSLDFISEEEINREVNDLIQSLGQESIQLPEEFDLEEEEKTIAQKEQKESEPDDDLSWLDESEVDDLAESEEDSSVSSQPEEMTDDAESLSLEDIDSLMAGGELYEDTHSSSEADAESSMPSSEASASEDSDVRITLGGVPIRLQSLKEACESIFEEPVELVTDEELVGEDKVVVVGKECGIHVMYCSREKILPPPPESMSIDESVSVSADSIRSAFSAVYGEPIEIVPDRNLLDQGIIPFSGKNSGLMMVKHPRVQVSLEETIPSAQPDEGAEQFEDLQRRVSELEERLAALATAPSPVSEHPVASETPEPAPQPEEPTHDEGIAQQPISLEDMEPEELEPVAEHIEEDDLDTDEETDEDILSVMEEVGSALEMQEENESQQQEEGQQEQAASESEEGGEEDDDLGNLEELADIDNLDDLLGEEVTQEGGQETEEQSSEDEGEEELDLENIDFGELEDEAESETAEGEEETDDETENAEIGEEELDLDVLSELENESDDFTPEEVFQGERILLLGGEDEHIDDYDRIVRELGGTGEWYGSLGHMQPDEIHELIESANIIMTVTGEALSDPGIMQAVNYAQDNQKQVYEHHSSNPTSVQKHLMSVAKGEEEPSEH